MISIQNLKKSYGTLTAVDDVSLSIKKGECFGLLGPNGAGKTTTINMMLGLIKPDAGTVRFEDGADPASPAARKRLGASPQSLSIYPDLTGWENVEFFAGLYSFSGEALRKATHDALEFVGLLDRAKDRAGTYSGGMQRRLNIACAVAHGPDMVLLDEPTVGVDPQSRNLIFDNIEALKKRGVTVLYTTHYMEEAARLCDRVAIMDAGKVLALDTVDALVTTHGGAGRIEVIFEKNVPASLQNQGELTNGVFCIRSAKPLEMLATVAACGEPMKSLNLHRSTLEDVFLNLTGRRLRD